MSDSIDLHEVSDSQLLPSDKKEPDNAAAQIAGLDRKITLLQKELNNTRAILEEKNNEINSAVEAKEAAELNLYKHQLIKDHNLHDDSMKFLSGLTREELEEQAESLKGLIGDSKQDAIEKVFANNTYKPKSGIAQKPEISLKDWGRLTPDQRARHFDKISNEYFSKGGGLT